VTSQTLNASVGRNIKARRLALSLSQEALAEACDLHRTYVGAVERGERNITLASLEKLAVALKCKPQALLDARPPDV
jgi:transcriptional regulator with XRE-family HTH domain